MGEHNDTNYFLRNEMGPLILCAIWRPKYLPMYLQHAATCCVPPPCSAPQLLTTGCTRNRLQVQTMVMIWNHTAVFNGAAQTLPFLRERSKCMTFVLSVTITSVSLFSPDYCSLWLELAAKSWRNFLMRNQSAIIDTFYGVNKCRMVCNVCKNAVITFHSAKESLIQHHIPTQTWPSVQVL